MQKETKMIKRYIRDEHHNPRGVVVLVRDEDGRDYFGYSLCNPSDKFDKKLGTTIALARATSKKLEKNEAFAPLVVDRRELVLDYYLALEDDANKKFA